MLLRREALDRIVRGEVDLVFRIWRKPTVKTGGRLRTAAGELCIVSVAEADSAELQASDARRAGFAGVAALRESLGPEPGQLYRIEVRFGGADRRLARREETSAAAVAEVLERLEQFDRRGPWTTETLTLIKQWPGRRAPELAELLGRETAPFKASVRKLKELGLTISLDVGYRLSPRGEAVLAAAAVAAAGRRGR